MQNSLSNRNNNEAKKLLQWIKESVHSPRCSSLQDLGNGVVWCRLMAKLRPGSLASVLVINRPANVSDSLHNYTLLEAAFNKSNMLWNFDTRKLIAGNIPELLRLARRMSRLHGSTQMPVVQFKESLQSLISSRQTRFPAGELELPQHLTSQRSYTTVSQVDPVAVGQPPPTEQAAAIRVDQQLRHSIRQLFCNQQSALKAYLAVQESGTLPTDIATANCFCKNCSGELYSQY